MSSYNDIGIDKTLDWERIRKLMVIGIPLEGLCYFGVYRLIASRSMHYAHIYRSGIFGYLIFGHLCYLVDDTLLFTGDSIALNKEGGWCFFDIFNYDSKLNKASLAALKNRVDLSAFQCVFTSHNGFTDDAQSAFRHIEVIPDLNAKGFLFDETAPYDCFDMKG